MSDYGFTVAWSDKKRGRQSVTVFGYSDPKEAKEAAERHAKDELGWTPPRWWQWRRWSEAARWQYFMGSTDLGGKTFD